MVARVATRCGTSCYGIHQFALISIQVGPKRRPCLLTNLPQVLAVGRPILAINEGQKNDRPPYAENIPQFIQNVRIIRAELRQCLQLTEAYIGQPHKPDTGH